MKEATLFESWANDLVENIGTRPLPLANDLKHKAEVEHPDLDPEDAVLAYVADKLSASDKVDSQQNKQISSIDKEVDHVEQDEEEIQAEIARLMQLVKNSN